MDTALTFKILAYTALSLLVLVTLGIGYLTVSDWRDRRRRENERRDTQNAKATPAKAKR